MHAWAVALLLAGNVPPEGWRSKIYYQDSASIYLPCQPVYIVTPLEGDPCVCVEKVVAKPAEESAMPVSSSDETVAEAVSLNQTFPLKANMTIGELALDWGVASIGPGTLYPTTFSMTRSFGGFFPPRSFSDPRSTTFVPPIIINPGPSGEPKPIPNPNPTVPEPASLAIWGTLAAAGAAFRSRKR